MYYVYICVCIYIYIYTYTYVLYLKVVCCFVHLLISYLFLVGTVTCTTVSDFPQAFTQK